MRRFSRTLALVCGLLVFSSAESFSSSRSPADGQITNLTFSFLFGATPGLDQFDASGSYVLGSGNNGIHLPGEAVVVSFDSGHFTQIIPSNSFVAISGGYSYTAPTGSSGASR